jgi:hypothetical protein
MYKWWWWWVPWLHTKWKVEKRRVRAQSVIEWERVLVEEMAQRPRKENDPFNNQDQFNKVISNLEEIHESAKTESNYHRLADLMDKAELQGQYRGYFCPADDIQREGELLIDLLKEWGVPKSITADLSDNVDEDLKTPAEGRAALHFLFGESDSWSDYTSDYEDTMERYTIVLFVVTVVLAVGSAFCFHWAFHFRPLLVFGLLGAGIAGSCVSIMRRMPELEVSLSKELDAYKRRILSRIGVGIAASLIGSALLGWGVLPLSIQGQTFTGALSDCAATCSTSWSSACTSADMLILLGIPMLLGFSERALIWLEQRLFGQWTKTRKTA